MSAYLELRRIPRAIIAAVAAIIMVATLAVVKPSQAEAANRDWLRPDNTGYCEWDPVQYWVQRCDVWSPAMGRDITVQIQPAKNGGNAGYYLLDGLRAMDHTSAWVHDVNAARTFVHDNITLIMPVGGAASFYTDWVSNQAHYDPRINVNYKWETFLSQELPAYLEQHFGVARNNNAIAGLSMGGTAALNLAANHPHQFRQVLSFSGYLSMTNPGMHTALRLALLDAGGYNINAMYGFVTSPKRFSMDPFLNIHKLRGKDIYVSAASGLPAREDANVPVHHQLSGAALEAFSMITTRAWSLKAHLEGVPHTTNFPHTGLHNWNQFGWQLQISRERVLNHMNAHGW